jgi:hypothetical protein
MCCARHPLTANREPNWGDVPSASRRPAQSPTADLYSSDHAGLVAKPQSRVPSGLLRQESSSSMGCPEGRLWRALLGFHPTLCFHGIDRTWRPQNPVGPGLSAQDPPFVQDSVLERTAAYRLRVVWGIDAFGGGRKLGKWSGISQLSAMVGDVAISPGESGRHLLSLSLRPCSYGMCALRSLSALRRSCRGLRSLGWATRAVGDNP